MNFILELFQYDFMVKALIVGLLVAVCAALIGSILVLKRYSLLGHGLGDIGFGSLALAFVLNLPPLAVSIPLVILAAFLIMFISQKKQINGDVIIGIFATASLSIGVIISSFAGGFNANLSSYMFGSILIMSQADMMISIVVSLLIIAIYFIFYHRLVLVIFDEDWAIATGQPMTIYQFLISLLTALTVVLGMRMMGTLLISSLIIIPVVSAKMLAKSFRSMVILSMIISAICFIIGLIGSYYLNVPTGAFIVVSNVIVLALAYLSLKIFRFK